MQHPLIDSRLIKEALSVFIAKKQITELRILGVRESNRWSLTLFGYFDNVDQILEELLSIENADGFFFIPNPVNPALLARSCNRLRRAEKNCSTSDHDVLRRNWLLVDCDPVRPSGVSSTDQEHENALSATKRISHSLREDHGWPDSIAADSGNGAHLVYHIDLPAKDGGLVQRVLAALGEKYSDDKVVIDTSVHNPARMLKLYGTLVCKGDDTSDRPHRMSRIIRQPNTLQTVSEEQLKRISEVEEAGPSSRPDIPRDQSFDLEGWIRDHNVPVEGPSSWENGSGGKGQRWIFPTCPWNQDHSDRSAYIVRLEGGGISAGCHHNGCEGKGWRDLRDIFEPQWKDDKGKKTSGESSSEAESRGGTQASTLVMIAEGVCDLFTTPDSTDPEGYARVAIDSHFETIPVRSKGFRNWLAREFYFDQSKPPGSQAFSDALNIIEAKAIHDGEKHPVTIRVAQHRNQISFDLGDPLWQSVLVGEDGWKTVASSETPVRFIRRRGMKEIPKPETGGNLDALRQLINIPDDDGFYLLIGWIVAALRPNGPYCILIINGEQGSAKSTLARIVRSLIDPNLAALRRPPRSDRDLMIAANNSWIIGFDNVSGIPPWLSDSLCTLATGGGYATRELYSDDSEKLFDAMRPILLNGIDDLASRPDLTDRAIILTLPRIRTRRSERDIWSAFEICRPKVLGCLLDAVSAALRNLPSIGMDLEGFRMADFVEWVTAAEPALGFPPGSLVAAYRRNRAGANSLAIEASPIGSAVINLVESHAGSWKGTATELLEALARDHATDEAKKRKDWPRSPRAISGALRRLAPALLAAGFDVRFNRSGDSRNLRLIHLEEVREQPSEPSVNPVNPSDPMACASDGYPAGPAATVRDTVRKQVVENGAVTKKADDADGPDGRLHNPSGEHDRREEVQEWKV